MAIYRLSVQVLSRSKGRCSVAAAAYRAGERLLDERTGQTFDYSRKQHIAHAEILAPEHAPEWATDREKLWNAVEAAEKRKDSQLAREIQLALPVELSEEGQLELLRRFARDRYVERGMVVDLAVHRPDGQPHAHLMLTMRELDQDGFGGKRRDWNADFACNRGSRQRFVKGADQLLDDREAWAEYANEALAREGYLERIDHRSLADREIELEPQPKLGRPWDEAAKSEHAVTEGRLETVLRTQLENGERLRADPSIVLHALTQQQAVFTREQVLAFVNTHTATAEQFDDVRARVFARPELVELGHDRRGRELFSTAEMVAAERHVMQLGAELSGRQGHHAVESRFVDQAVATRTLSDEQRAALEYVTRGSGDLALVEGYAGTGKSYMLGAAREAWEAQGYTVIGAALAGKAAEGLEVSAGIPSGSLASWEYRWGAGRDQLTDQHVLVIDEAGMVGTRQMDRVLSAAREAGAKVVLVGDTRQLQAIEAGAPMRALRAAQGGRTLAEIRRQKIDWQRDAARQMAHGHLTAALSAYRAAGFVHRANTEHEAVEALVQRWAKDEAVRGGSSMMFAYRRDQVAALNEAARSVRQARGELGEGQRIQTERGMREMAVGERVFFLRNDRALGVTNGTLGTVEAMKGDSLVVRTDEGKQVAFSLADYRDLDYGYAGTVHKGQGATVDRAYVLASKHFDASSAYVTLSRHRDGAHLYWSDETFKSWAEVQRTFARDRAKEMALEQPAQVRLPAELESLPARLPESDRELLDLYQRASKEGRDVIRTTLAEQAKRPRLDEQKLVEQALAVERQRREHTLEEAARTTEQAREALGTYQAKLFKKQATLNELQRAVAAAEDQERSAYSALRRFESDWREFGPFADKERARARAHNEPLDRAARQLATLQARQRVDDQQRALDRLAERMTARSESVRYRRATTEDLEQPRRFVRIAEAGALGVAMLRGDGGEALLTVEGTEHLRKATPGERVRMAGGRVEFVDRAQHRRDALKAFCHQHEARPLRSRDDDESRRYTLLGVHQLTPEAPAKRFAAALLEDERGQRFVRPLGAQEDRSLRRYVGKSLTLQHERRAAGPPRPRLAPAHSRDRGRGR